MCSGTVEMPVPAAQSKYADNFDIKKNSEENMSDNVPSVFASRVKVEITERNMKVFLEVKEPATEEAQSITSKDIIDILTNEGVVFGIDNDLIDEIVNEKKWGEKFIVAIGKYPPPGDDAKFEFSFPTDKSFKPQIKEDGHIDYHEISIVNSVQKDDILVKKSAPTMGTTGMTVLGTELPAVSGKDIAIQVGQGAFRDPSDNTIIKASVDGIIFFDAKKNYVEVQKMFSVKGSVDFSTGNLNVKSSVEIKGDVNPGFSIKTPYDIQINGSVEQGIISCEGSLKVNKGIVGDSKLLIYAGGDIHAGYINNQNVKCKGSLYVSTEIRNSIIECGGEVVLVKGDGVILGGKVFASNKLTVATIGNKYNVPTEIEVGILLEHKEKHDLKKTEISAVHKTISNLNKNIAEISALPPNSKNEQKAVTLRDECDASILHLDRLRNELFEIEKLASTPEPPTISVTKTVYPGTILRIRHACFEVKQDLTHVKFSLVNGEITYTNIK